MRQKSKWLSIGDISKLSGASIKALRYYEKINLLQPAWIDPASSYRYYTYDQIYLLEIIMFCVELDIPLKELTQYIDENKVFDMSGLLAHGKKSAEEKLRRLERGLRFIDNLEEEIALAKKYDNGGAVYARDIAEITCYLMPFAQSLEETDPFEVAKAFLDADYEEKDDGTLPAYGFLYEYAPTGIQRYAFMECPPHRATGACKIIPAGRYYCRQSDRSNIEKAPQVFEGNLQSKESFLAVEVELFTSKFVIDQPMHELRVIKI